MNKLEAVQFCIENEQNFAQRLNSKTVSVNKFIQVISEDSYNLKELGLSAGGISKLLKRVFPSREGNIKACTYLLSLHNFKYCNKCKVTKHLDTDFYKSKDRGLDVQDFCKKCMDGYTHITANERMAKRRASKLQAIPAWADLEKIKEIYDNCPEGYHVDHEVPLQGANVCGLHVEYNLQYLTANDNLSKGNSHAP